MNNFPDDKNQLISELIIFFYFLGLNEKNVAFVFFKSNKRSDVALSGLNQKNKSI